MRILLDASVPADFRHELAAAGTVQTAHDAGISHLSNGALIAAMTGRFDVLVTVDASLPYQNTIVGRPISVIVLRAPSNVIADLRPLAPATLSALSTIRPGMVVQI